MLLQRRTVCVALQYIGVTSIDTSRKAVPGRRIGCKSNQNCLGRREIITALAAATLLSACQTTRGKAIARLALPLELPEPGLSGIYFYRKEGQLFRAVEPEVIVNGASVGISRPGETFFRQAKPGRYQVFSTAEPNEIIYLDARAERLSFVEMEVVFTGLGWQLLPVERSEREAVAALEGLSLIVPGT